MYCDTNNVTLEFKTLRRVFIINTVVMNGMKFKYGYNMMFRIIYRIGRYFRIDKFNIFKINFFVIFFFFKFVKPFGKA